MTPPPTRPGGTMTRLDLDAVERLPEHALPLVAALVAELRVARRVQDQLHTQVRDRSPLGAALAEWDQFTRPAPEATP